MNGVERIAKERQRQIEKGYTKKRDARLWSHGQLAWGACYFAMPGDRTSQGHIFMNTTGWGITSSKRTADTVENLTKAGALIAAELDRILCTDTEECENCGEMFRLIDLVQSSDGVLLCRQCMAETIADNESHMRETGEIKAEPKSVHTITTTLPRLAMLALQAEAHASGNTIDEIVRERLLDSLHSDDLLNKCESCGILLQGDAPSITGADGVTICQACVDEAKEDAAAAPSTPCLCVECGVDPSTDQCQCAEQR